jgi:hypothetical protein
VTSLNLDLPIALIRGSLTRLTVSQLWNFADLPSPKVPYWGRVCTVLTLHL